MQDSLQSRNGKLELKLPSYGFGIGWVKAWRRGRGEGEGVSEEGALLGGGGAAGSPTENAEGESSG